MTDKCNFFGIYDLDKSAWILDQFDSPLLFLSFESAEKHRAESTDYNSKRYEVKQWIENDKE